VDSLTRIIPLAETTRKDNLGTFPDFRTLDEVPKHGVSVGVGTILKHSKEAVLVIHGKHKQGAVKRLTELSDFNSDWPVSLIYRCPKKRIYVDKSAAFTA
jgi:glucosamine-6-phosphate deaminase